MNKRGLAGLAAAAMIVLAPGLRAAEPASAGVAPGTAIGNALYGASFKDMNDQMAGMAQFKGKVLVMYYWATWCVPCRVETPNLVKLNQQYAGKNVQVVGLALDNGDKVRDFVRDNHITYPVFYGGHNAVELGKAMGNEEGAIPFTVVIDQSGRLIHSFKGDLPNAELEKIVNPLIG